MNRYEVTCVRRAGASPAMPFDEVTLIVAADDEDAAELLADDAITRLAGLGQLDVDAVWQR